MLPEVYESHDEEQSLEVTLSLSYVSHNAPTVSSDYMVTFILSNLFVLPTNTTMTHEIE